MCRYLFITHVFILLYTMLIRSFQHRKISHKCLDEANPNISPSSSSSLNPPASCEATVISVSTTIPEPWVLLLSDNLFQPSPVTLVCIVLREMPERSSLALFSERLPPETCQLTRLLSLPVFDLSFLEILASPIRPRRGL